MASFLANFTQIMLATFFLLTVYQLTSASIIVETSTSTSPTISLTKNETEARCQQWVKNGDTVSRELATLCLEHYTGKLSDQNMPNCKYEIANIFCKKSPLAATITAELQAWTIARVHLVLATSRMSSNGGSGGSGSLVNLTEARALAAEAARLLDYHWRTPVVVCRPADADCQRCVSHNLNCIYTKFARRDVCTSEAFYRVVGHTPRLIEEDCKVMLLE